MEIGVLKSQGQTRIKDFDNICAKIVIIYDGIQAK